MARIAGIDLPRQKRIDIALTYIHGIGRTSAVKICQKARVPRRSCGAMCCPVSCRQCQLQQRSPSDGAS